MVVECLVIGEVGKEKEAAEDDDERRGLVEE
jgi:hypothetical protein